MSHIGSVQALRAVAAILVAFGHLRNETLTFAAISATAATGVASRIVAGTPTDGGLLDITAAGVDLFFVISGFVMVFASRRLFETAGGWRVFLARRIARIVPFYWLMTTIYLSTMLLAASALSSAAPTAMEIARSYLFVPYLKAGADMAQPVYKLGWTLNYEMFFYVVFAGLLFLPMRIAVAAIVTLFTLTAVAGALVWQGPPADAWVPLMVWSHPIILEFAMGALIAMAWLEGVRLGRTPAIAIMAAGVLAIALSAFSGLSAHGTTRPLIWGIPAALILAAATLAEHDASPRGGRMATVMLAFGDASYAIYLLHPIVVRGLRLVWDKSGATAHLPPLLFIAVGLALVLPLALVVHRWLEQPMTAWAQRLLGTDPKRKPTIVAAPLAASRHAGSLSPSLRGEG